MFLGVLLAVWLVAFVIYVGRIGRDSTTRGEWLYVVLGAGVVCLGLIQRVRSKPLDTRDPTRLAGSYRGLTFVGIGLTESAALVGFVPVLLGHRRYLYLIGAGIATLGLLLVAPSRHEIERRQFQIERAGSTLSLGAALVEPLARPGSGKGA